MLWLLKGVSEKEVAHVWVMSGTSHLNSRHFPGGLVNQWAANPAQPIQKEYCGYTQVIYADTVGFTSS